MKFDPVNLDMIFETSWEVCNKIGGIYTVLSTKAQTLQNLYKDKTIFIGPDVWTDDNPSPYFSEVPSLLKPWRDKALLPEGVSVRVGRWNIPGKPIVILVNFQGMYKLKDYYYGEMWERFGVDSLHAYGDYDEGCAFALAAGVVIESICSYKRMRHKNVLAHFDEWTTGMGLLYTKWKVPFVGTIFTTHATSIGRSICGNGKPLYDYLPGYNGDQMARELKNLSRSGGMAQVVVTHDLALAQFLADTLAVLHERRFVEYGPADAVLRTPGPYTRRLLEAVPRLKGGSL